MSAIWWPLPVIVALAILAALIRPEAYAGWLVLSLGLAGLLAHHLGRLIRMEHALGGDLAALPAWRGAWGELVARIAKRLGEERDTRLRAVADLEHLLVAARSLPDGIIVLDRSARILWLNDAAGTLLGLTRGRDEGQFLHYLLRGGPFMEWLALDEPGRSLTMHSPRRPETRLTLRIVPMPEAQRMLIAQDVTEVERVEAMRRDFVANVSHELRTPITVLAGFLEAFEDMPDPEPAAFKRHIHLMHEQTERMRHLLDDLLTLARLESEPALGNETVDTPALAAELLAEARSLSQGRHAIELHLESDARLIGNATELRSALGNLVVNAVRYTPEGERIDLYWRDHEPAGAEFAVADSGEGIEARHIPRLTERFYRVDRGRSRATGGTGLGLAIVKHILQRHGARLRIDSTVGKGSTFSALFPEDRVIPASSPPAPAPDAP